MSPFWVPFLYPKLRDLNGIARSMETRLHAAGIHTVTNSIRFLKIPGGRFHMGGMNTIWQLQRYLAGVIRRTTHV